MKRAFQCFVFALPISLLLTPFAYAFNIPPFSLNNTSGGFHYTPPEPNYNETKPQATAAVPGQSLEDKLFFAVSDINKVRELLEQGADVNGDNCWHTPALVSAARCQQNLDVIRLLIERGANVNAKDKDGNTALMMAVKNGYLDKIQLLIANGADVNARDNKGSSVLMQNAADTAPLGFIERNANFVQLLIESGADVNAIDKDGKTALMYAADRKEMGPHILTIGTGGISLRRNIGVTYTGNFSFHSISKIINPEIENSAAYVIALLLDAGANVNAKDLNGKTALMYAASTGNTDAIFILLYAGADEQLVDNSGWTALKWAIYNNQMDAASALKDAESWLAVIAKQQDDFINAAGSGDLKSIRACIKAGVNIDAKNKYGFTALMYGTYYNHPDIVRVLLENGANLNARDSYGRTALDLAEKSGYNNIVGILKNASLSK